MDSVHLTHITHLTRYHCRARTLILLSEDKPYVLWALQVCVSAVILCFALAALYVSSVSRVCVYMCVCVCHTLTQPHTLTQVTWQSLLRTVSPTIAITVILPMLYLITLVYPPTLRSLFIPSFFYCFPASFSLSTALLQALQRSSRSSKFKLKMIALTSVFLCFLFTW